MKRRALFPALRPPAEARDLAALAVAGGLPVGRRDLADPAAYRADQRRTDGVGDLPPLEPGEEVLAPEALVGTQKQPRPDRQATSAFVQEAGRAGRSGGVAVAELRVQPLTRLADKAEQRVPADLALVAAARPLPGTDRAVMLDVGRVDVERHRLPVEQRMHTREQLVECPVELADVTEAEAAQKTAERRRLGQPVTAQKLLRRVGPHQRDVVEALAASDQRLTQAEDRLRR
jgi:hypothetical protein